MGYLGQRVAAAFDYKERIEAMNEGVKVTIDFASTLVEVLPLVVASFASVAPVVKLVLYGIALTSMTWRFVTNRKNTKENQSV